MIGALLRRAAEASRRVLFRRLREAGHGELRDAHLALFAFPGPHGARPTELANRLGLSKQTLNPLLNDLERLDYIARIPDPIDGRQRILQLTSRGNELLKLAERILIDIESQLAVEFGDRSFARFRAMLTQFPAALEGAQPSDGTDATQQSPTRRTNGH